MKADDLTVFIDNGYTDIEAVRVEAQRLDPAVRVNETEDYGDRFATFVFSDGSDLVVPFDPSFDLTVTATSKSSKWGSNDFFPTLRAVGPFRRTFKVYYPNLGKYASRAEATKRAKELLNKPDYLRGVKQKWMQYHVGYMGDE